MSSRPLLPCPFCGGDAELMVNEIEQSTYGTVMCMSCYACGPEKDHWAEAERCWNSRVAAPDQPSKEVQ